MARNRPSQSFEKRQRERAKQQKRQEKQARRRERKAFKGEGGGEAEVDPLTGEIIPVGGDPGPDVPYTADEEDEEEKSEGG